MPVLNSGFGREVDENFALLGYYAASSANFLQTFRVILAVPSSKVKKTYRSPLNMGTIGCLETSIQN